MRDNQAVVCSCARDPAGGGCGDGTDGKPECQNRLSFVECIGCAAEGKGASKKKGKGGDFYNCGAATAGGKAVCKNRLFAKKRWSKTQIVRTLDRGWGLNAAEDIAPGALVIEYMGEVLSTDQGHARLAAQMEKGEHAVYVMELNGAQVVDARHKGNVSRFINHACDPNCELQRWNVNGYTRIGIFARRAIAKAGPRA